LGKIYKNLEPLLLRKIMKKINCILENSGKKKGLLGKIRKVNQENNKGE